MAKSYVLVVLAILSGGALMGLLSQPGVSFRAHPQLAYLSIGLAGIAVASCQILLVKGAKSDAPERQTYLWAVGLVVLSWLVAFFSSPSGASGGMVAMAMRLFGLSQPDAQTVVFWTRKAIHFTFYGTLAWVAFRWLETSGVPIRRAAPCALAIAFVHACYDEGRQMSFSDRTSSGWDVVLDMAGGFAFVGLATRREISKR